MVHSTWYGVRGPHNFLGVSVDTTKFGTKVVTATYFHSDCENSLYYRTSHDHGWYTILQAVV